MKFKLLPLIILLFFSCNKEEKPLSYTISGRVSNSSGLGIEAVKIQYSTDKFVLSDAEGYWMIPDLTDQNTLRPILSNYSFSPSSIQVSSATAYVRFTATQDSNDLEEQLFNWFDQQQLSNGLLESTEDGNYVSLYDNALAAMVYMLNNDFAKAEQIFDFFNARISTELTNGVGGFSQFRYGNGNPTNYRWMGDNAWLLIALNNYKDLTGNNTYDNLSSAISNWLISLQDVDGGLFAGYDSDNSRLNFKVTEGNIDAFNAIDGYTLFHSELLDFLENDRWDAVDKNLVAWPTNPPYLYALDLHSWSYLIFDRYPLSALTTAERFLTTQIATNGIAVTGYCFDEDKDTAWPEGMGQMAVAFGSAGLNSQKELYLNEMEKLLLQSPKHENAVGFPYASNPGTTYGSDALWVGADTDIALSGAAWYLFAKKDFNPFAVGQNKIIPEVDLFWLN